MKYRSLTKSQKKTARAGVKALLKCAAAHPFDQITLYDIAQRADLPLSDLADIGTSDDFIDMVEPFFDRALVDDHLDFSDPPTERLFEVIMQRFEAMEVYRDGLTKLMAWRDLQPSRRAALLTARRETAKWSLIAAGLDKGGQVEQLARGAGLIWALARAETAWRKDENGDFARTMAKLDADLKSLSARAERVKKWAGWVKPKKSDVYDMPESWNEG